MQHLEYALPLERQRRSQWLHFDVYPRIRTMLTVLMPEEYEGQHQLIQKNRLSIELYMLSNGQGLYDSYHYYDPESLSEHNKRLLAMVRTLGWHKGCQFGTLLASQEPTIEAIAEKIFASAVLEADIEVVKLILETGMDPDSLIECWNGNILAPLQLAATTTNSRGAEMAELLISHKADIELHKDGSSPLLVAISTYNEEVIEVLLRHNAIVNLRCLEEATGIVDANVFEELLSSCADINRLIYNTMIPTYGGKLRNVTLLGAAANSGRLEIIETILRVCPSLVNPRELEASGGEDYFSPISVAIRNGHTKALKALLDAGVNTNFVNGREKSPIKRALEGHNLGAYEILVESGATLTQPLSYKGLRVLMRFTSREEDCVSTMRQLIDENAQLSRNVTEWSGEVLAEAINNNDLLVIGLLLDSGATIDPNKVFYTWKKTARYLDTAQYLDTRGALQAILDGNGPKLLLTALKVEEWDLAQWLLIREPILLDESLYSEQTPLSSAARSKQPELVRLILKHGARVTDRALFMAIKRIKNDIWTVKVPSDEAVEVLRLLLSHFTGPAPSAIAEAAHATFRDVSIDNSTGHNIGMLQLLLSEGLEPTGTPQAVFGECNFGPYEPQSALEWVVFNSNRLSLDILTRFPYHWSARDLGRALVVACHVSRFSRENFVDPILQRKPKMNEEVRFWRYWASPEICTALQVAVGLRNASLVGKLLGFADTDVDYAAKGRLGRTALQHAVENGDLELITMLLNHNADVNSPPAENGGATALQLAAINGYLPIARRLLDLGANVNAAAADIDGRTALEGAAEHGRIDMVHMLLDEGALVFGDAGEKQYKNAVALARKNGKYAVARMLERFRAKTEQAHMQTSDISMDGGGEVYEEEEHLIM